jgi:serine/threonine protein kinase/TolA-binding protein
LDCADAVYAQLQQVDGKDMLKKIIENPRRESPKNYEIIKNLAKGGYGEVYVVRNIETQKVYAMKKISKDSVLKQPHTALFMSERQVMIDSKNSKWLVSIHRAFQDIGYLYFIMDFLPGGDLMGLLSRKEVLNEDWVRFYSAEIILSLEELHSLGYIHRDVKPDNILITRTGHIKLADFGSCINMVSGKARSSITVGTPDYVSPDILNCVGEECEYGVEVDLWTMGVVLYEMIYGTPPFYSDTLHETYKKISNVEITYKDEGVSPELQDLMKKLICKKESRIGIQEIKSHPFFKGIDWDGIIESTSPPFVPEVTDDVDISNFVDTLFDPSINEFEDGLSFKSSFLKFIGFSYDPKIKERFFEERKGSECSPDHLTDEACKIKELRIEAPTEQQVNSKLLCLEDGMQKFTYRSQPSTKKLIKELIWRLRVSIEDVRMEYEGLVESIDLVVQENRFLSKEMFLFRKRLSELGNKKDTYEVEAGEIINRQNTQNVEELRKQLRMKRTEIREYQQKLEQEILLRQKLEDELVYIKGERNRRERVIEGMRCFTVKVMYDKEFIRDTLIIENNTLMIKGKKEDINNVYVESLRNNELYHLPPRKRRLILRIVIIKETDVSVSSVSKKSIKQLEEEVKREENIKKGIESLMGMVTGKVLSNASKQLEGTERKIAQLRGEIDRMKRNTDIKYEKEEPLEKEKCYEFNNHQFVLRTFAEQTLCSHCNEILYGGINQGLECRECHMVTHKACYVLGSVSCELFKAIIKGKSYYVVMRSGEDKDKFMKILSNG